MTHHHVTESVAGGRLDAWLAQVCPGYSRSRLQTMIREGHVLVDGERARPSLALVPGMDVTLNPPQPEAVDVVPQELPLDILFEDEHLIVINKAAGRVVHPAAGHRDGTLVNALLHHCQDLKGIGGELRPGIVHRLDKDTSGVLVVAKHEQALQALVSQFQARQVRKTYVAFVKGILVPREGRIETLIGRSASNRKKMAVVEGRGRVAITRYCVEKQFESVAYVSLNIETGRTHQIRVHMSHLGHPVLGDEVYGRSSSRLNLPVPVSRQMLHARQLEIRHPVNGDTLVFEAPLPDDMLGLLKELSAKGVE